MLYFSRGWKGKGKGGEEPGEDMRRIEEGAGGAYKGVFEAAVDAVLLARVEWEREGWGGARGGHAEN